MKRSLFLAAALLAVGAAQAGSITVTWTNAVDYTVTTTNPADNTSVVTKEPMPLSDIVSTTARCGLSLGTLTYSKTVSGPLTSAVIPLVPPGSYLCVAIHTSKLYGNSALSDPANPVTMTAPIPVVVPKPSAPTNVKATAAP